MDPANEAETLAAAVSAFTVLDPGTTGGPPIAVDRCGPGVLCPTDRLTETETVYKTTLSTTEITTTRVETVSFGFTPVRRMSNFEQ